MCFKKDLIIDKENIDFKKQQYTDRVDKYYKKR